MKPFQYFLNRLREPSTLAGIGVIALLAGLPQEKVNAITQAVGGVAAAAAIFLPDAK